MNNRSRGGKRSKPTKMNLRVDFTPMVDMNMLLITFFMFCTTLSIPQAMDIVLPTKEIIDDGPIAPSNKTITLLLGENNKVYYYEGKPDYENYASLKETDYSAIGLRNILLNKNDDQVNKAIGLKRKRKNKEISESNFKLAMSELKKSKEGIVVIIKPTDASSYKNLVDALDEMQVCSIGKYAIVGVEKSDEYLLENYKTKGKFTAKL